MLAWLKWKSNITRAIALKNIAMELLSSEKREVPRLLPAPAEEGFVKSFDGTEVFFERHGPDPRTSEKTPMIFCYGLVCSINQWRFQVERYSKDNPVIIFDYRGHNKSKDPSDPTLMNISALAQDAYAVMKHFGEHRSFHIWGHSLGVNVALELSLIDPEICKTLVLVCGTAEDPFANMFHTNALQKAMKPILQLDLEDSRAFEVLWRKLLSNTEVSANVFRFLGFNHTAAALQDVDTYAHAVASSKPKTLLPLLKEMSKSMTRAILPKVKVPCLVISGKADFITPSKAQHQLATGLPSATLVEIPGGSHNVQLDFGEYVCLKVEEWWRLNHV